MFLKSMLAGYRLEAIFLHDLEAVLRGLYLSVFDLAEGGLVGFFSHLPELLFISLYTQVSRQGPFIIIH